MIEEMAKEGERIIKDCENERDYTHRTQNLYDSYGYGVYYNGALKKIGFLSSSPSAVKSKKWYGEGLKGREEIKAFLNKEYSASKGLELVIAAAMPYAVVLEQGVGVSHKYKVISMSYDKLKEICPSFGTVKNFII